MINTMQKYKWHSKNKYRAIYLNCSPYLVWTNLSGNLAFNKKCLAHFKETECLILRTVFKANIMILNLNKFKFECIT